MIKRLFFLSVLTLVLGQSPSFAQDNVESILLTIDDAKQMALAKSYAVRQAEVNVYEADGLIKQGWSSLFPQVNFSSSYTRNVKSANPFSGSDAGSLFASFAFVDWLAFNENARVDSDPTTEPITLADFFERRNRGLADAGIELNQSDNPFAVPNQVISGISVEQKIFDIAAFMGANAGAKYLRSINKAGLRRSEQLAVDATIRAYYGALLAQQQSDVVRASLERTRKTHNETAIRVSQGILPKYSRLSAQVAVSNLESNLIESRNRATQALDNLKITIGLPVSQPIRLSGDFDQVETAMMIQTSTGDNIDEALQRRPDYEQALLAIDLENLRIKAERGGFFPSLSAFANFNYIGNVPDVRQFTVADPDDPFKFQVGQNGIFSDNYWDFTVSVGLSLRWTLFDGRRTSALVQQRRAARTRAALMADQLADNIRMEIQSAQRTMVAARARIAAQEDNMEAAELNYQYVRTRLGEGVASQLDERQASDLLDQSRLSYYQAIHDYLVSLSALETAMGVPAIVDEKTLSIN